ncbi:MAG: HdeD family acid-resistance protein [Candidatus Lustribacter sp.]|jgi:uncharacterized membrane protein HdeD (DUF308 family)
MVDPVLGQPLTANARRYWWLFLIRGLFGLALGVLAVMFPGATLAVVVILIGAYLIVDGIVTIAKAVQIMRSDAHWWVLLLEGILSVAVGVAIFAWPGLSILSLAYLVGYWAILTGALAIVTAFRLRAHIKGEWLYLLFGIVSVIFGGFVLFAPATGLVYIVLMISIYGFVIGFTMIALAFRARNLPA